MKLPDPLHPTEAARRWRAARRVLLVRLDNLGDVLMTTPAFAAVRQSLPQARLTLLASPSGAAALAHVPALDEVIVYDAPWSKGGGAPRGGIESAAQDRQMIERLAQQRFDAAILFTVCTQSALPAALMCRLAGIPLRLAHARENPYDLLSDWVPDTDQVGPGMRHEVARQLALVAAVGLHPRDDGLVFRYRAEDVRSTRRKFAEAGGEPMRPYFVVHAGASAASRRYPAARFGAAARQIADATGCQPVFTGGSDERGLVDEAMAALQGPAVSLAGALNLGEFAALLAGAQVLVSNNTGPVHMAAALGTPVVDLYALTNPQHTPWKVRARVLNHDVPCRNCFRSICPEGHNDCLRLVEPQAVARAAQELMGVQPAIAVPLPVQARVSQMAAL